MTPNPGPGYAPGGPAPESIDLGAALLELLAAERAGARVATESLRQAVDPRHRVLLERIRVGEAESCRRLIACLEHLGLAPASTVGDFHGKAMAIGNLDERLAFVDRGQRWVIRRITAMLPGCGDPFIRQELELVLKIHEVNSRPPGMATFVTRLTLAMDLRHPVVLAPMAFAAGGALAAAVSRAGGLGLIGGGYGDSAWLQAQFAAAGGERAGVGFITWALKDKPSVLTAVLRNRPAAVMLSFGDPRPFADEIHASGAKLICQCQDLGHVADALEAGADIIVAQGSEAGGHGARRGTLTLVPEVADHLAAQAPETLLLAAGGIGDGRGLAAALALGADGVLVGTRLWASREALVNERHHQAILATGGDGTLRTTIPDIARQLPWPGGFTARIRRNAFTDRWHGREQELRQNVSVEGPRYQEAFAAGDPENAAVWFGEAAGVIHAIEPAAVLIERMTNEARRLLSGIQESAPAKAAS